MGLRVLTPKEIAEKIVADFDRDSTIKIRDAISKILKNDGLSSYEADSQGETLAPSILMKLREKRAEELPFRFGDWDSTRLVGKNRKRSTDSPETTQARETSKFVEQVHAEICAMHHFDFETICALSLKLTGADEAYALGTHDEGGIDIFGRLRIGSEIPIERGLLETNLLKNPKGLLFLGQCKRTESDVGRPEIQKFIEAVRECSEKYEGNPTPPSQRVDSNYYEKDEPCVEVFVTTASFTEPAAGLASSRNMFTITGRKLSEFLCSRRIGFEGENGFSPERLKEWVKTKASEVQYSGGHS